MLKKDNFMLAQIACGSNVKALYDLHADRQIGESVDLTIFICFVRILMILSSLIHTMISS